MASNLKAVRERCSDLTQADIASELGISVSAYQKWEQGKRSPNWEQVIALSRLLKVSADTLLGTSYAEEIVGRRDRLTDDEMELVDAYRSMDDGLRDALLAIARGLAG